MNSFAADDLWQRQVRDEVLAPGFYGKWATDGRYVVLDKGRLASILQQRSAVDTVVQGRNGTAIFIEEKIVRWKGRRYTSFFLETQSCTVPGHESTGWMFYGEADYLLYCFQLEAGDLDAWLIDFPRLQEWFWPIEETFPKHRMKTRNRTCGRLVPVDDVHGAVPVWRKHIPNGCPLAGPESGATAIIPE